MIKCQRRDLKSFQKVRHHSLNAEELVPFNSPSSFSFIKKPVVKLKELRERKDPKRKEKQLRVGQGKKGRKKGR